MFCHIDADSFFASVLLRKYPQYRGRPLIATGMGGDCVIAATYDAKAKGVRTGMRLNEAKKLCPNAVVLPSDFAETGLASQQIESNLQDICPFIEQASIDEWYLDLRSLPGGTPKDPYTWAKQLQEDIKRKTHIPVSIGVAPSKLLSKMGSEYHKPSGITIITNQERIRDTKYEIRNTNFLQDRKAAAIPGIGSRRQVHCESLNWNTAYDIAYADKQLIQKLFGVPGLEMQQELQGISVHPVIVDRKPPKSISRCRSFRMSHSKEILFAHLMHHVSYTVMKMRRHNLMCNWLYVGVRNNEYKSFGKDCKLPQPMDTEQQMLPYIKSLFGRLYDPQRGYTQISFALGNLKPKAPKQYSLFEDTKEIDTGEEIQKTLDALHKEFGRDAIVRGSAMHITSGSSRKLSILE